VYEPTPDPKRFTSKRLEVRLHLPDLIALTADPDDPLEGESVGSINLALENPKDADAVASLISTRVPGLIVASTTSTDGDDPFAVLDRFHWAIAIVTVTGSTAFLLALMIMRAEERREIIGILRLMGIPPRSILVEVLLEGLLIATAGAVFGVVVAKTAEGLVNRYFQWRYDTPLLFVRVTASIAWKAVAFSVPLGVVAGLAASWTLLRRDVVSLVRR
jgi:ABC-type lipoprotein release transport system permease subunit